jgi:regulator of replication initiation timing
MAFAARLIPWKYLGLWFGIIIAEIALIFILSFYRNGLQNQIYNLESEISTETENLQTLIKENESLKLLGQYLTIREILNRRKEVSILIERFAAKMPKTMQLDSMDIDVNKKTMKITGKFASWQDYVRGAAYFRKDDEFKLVDQDSPILKNNVVQFTWQINFK